MRKKVYFGHPINVYGTELQTRLLAAVTAAFPGWEIVNPDRPHHQEGYERWKRDTGRGMDYYFREVLPDCDAGVFLPFRDGAWGAGVHGEAESLASRGRPIFSIDAEGSIAPARLDAVRPLSVDETRARIRTPTGERRPF